MLIEATGGVISYVDVELKQTAPCSQTTTFDSEPVLGALSMNQSDWNLRVNKPTSTPTTTTNGSWKSV